MSRLADMASVNGSLRYSRDLLEHPGEVLTDPWWVMPGLDQGDANPPQPYRSKELRDYLIANPAAIKREIPGGWMK